MFENRLRILEPEKGWNPGPEWLTNVLDDFRKDLLNPEYPCIFGRRALMHRELFMTWVDHDDPSALPADLADFVDLGRREPEKRRPLAVFAQPAPYRSTTRDHDEHFWSLLQYLHDHDDRPWPEDVPTDPDAPGWTFAFHGASLFTFALSPANELRRSRNLCDALVLLFQPRSVFAGIEVGSVPGNAARRGIRERLSRWDPIDPHPSFGGHEQCSDDEWRQYSISDQNADLHPSCPFSYRGDRVSAEVSP